jgi:hypothetical protein
VRDISKELERTTPFKTEISGITMALLAVLEINSTAKASV